MIRPSYTEINIIQSQLTTETATGLNLHGRADLAIYTDEYAHLIDYKTGGRIASKKDVTTGCDIQLSYYALLEPKTRRVTYINPEKTTDLTNNVEELAKNLRTLIDEFKHDYENGCAMPARGRDTICKYCPFEGLCRKQMWRGNHKTRNEISLTKEAG